VVFPCSHSLSALEDDSVSIIISQGHGCSKNGVGHECDPEKVLGTIRGDAATAADDSDKECFSAQTSGKASKRGWQLAGMQKDPNSGHEDCRKGRL
jgi:hypothetical protein